MLALTQPLSSQSAWTLESWTGSLQGWSQLSAKRMESLHLQHNFPWSVENSPLPDWPAQKQWGAWEQAMIVVQRSQQPDRPWSFPIFHPKCRTTANAEGRANSDFKHSSHNSCPFLPNSFKLQYFVDRSWKGPGTLQKARMDDLWANHC